MAHPKVIPLFGDGNTLFAAQPSKVATNPMQKRYKNVVEIILDRPMMLAYQPGDRCIRCGNGGFHVGRTVATCANPHCQLPVPIG
jgi:hypothetical protein